MHNALLVLAKALSYKTCNNKDDNDGTCVYLYNVPKELESYLFEFAPLDGSVRITNGPIVLACHGFGRGTHSFIEVHGVTKCTMCNVTLCQFCVVKMADNMNHVLNAIGQKGLA